MTEQPIAFDLQSAAAAVGLSDRTLRDAIADGSLTAHYQGRKPLILRDDLIEYIRSLPTEKGGPRGTH